jgi:hypothetical protein
LDIDEFGTFGPGGPPGGIPAADKPAALPAGVALEGDLEDILIQETQNLLNGGVLMQTGGRYRDLRAARAEPPQWYERDPSDAAKQQSQAVRAEGARGRAWIARPLATGVFYFNPSYASARDDAYTQITSRADQLAGVRMEHFARPAASGSVQFAIFTQFARLIADMYRLNQHNGNRSAKLATDAANISGSIEAITRFFVARITFNEATSEFLDTGAARSLARQRPWTHASFVPRVRFNDAFADTRTNPLLAREWPAGDVRYLAGTLLAPSHS